MVVENKNKLFCVLWLEEDFFFYRVLFFFEYLILFFRYVFFGKMEIVERSIGFLFLLYCFY